MVTYVLDSSAILRYLDNEAGADRVEIILNEHLAATSNAAICSIHWGEIAGVVYKHRGRKTLDTVLARLNGLGLEIIPATADRAVRAACIKIDTGIPYADAFGVEAAESPQHIFVTADFDLKPAASSSRIEFLPRK